MRSAILFGACVLTAAALTNCYGDAFDEGEILTGDASAPTSHLGGDPEGESKPAVATGIPCDVRDLLKSECTSCHGVKPNSGVPTSLVTYEDLTAKSKSNSSKSNGELSVDRMKDAKSPMPQAGLLSAGKVSVLEDWVKKGMPRQACVESRNPITDAGVADTGPDPYATPTVCSSKTYWTKGDQKSSSMHPGGTCMDCHKKKGPTFLFAGTVYKTAHEPTDCNGVSSTVNVVVTDAKGQVLKVTTNSAGNFYQDPGGILGFGSKSITFPITAKVVVGSSERVMKQSITTGDCNTCHTEAGDQNAPGRIMAP